MVDEGQSQFLVSLFHFNAINTLTLLPAPIDQPIRAINAVM